MKKIAVFGFSGRCVSLLVELYNLIINTDIEIKVIAIYDDFYNEVLKAIPSDKIDKVKYLIDGAKIYSEKLNEETVYLENEFDLSFISSQNYKHYNSLLLALKYNKKIFCEKPIVNNLNDLLEIQKIYNNSNFQTGLTLRYAKMVDIVEKHLHKVGKLKKVYGLEFVNIGHGVHIMVGWRRYRNLSGGMGLATSISNLYISLYINLKGLIYSYLYFVIQFIFHNTFIICNALRLILHLVLFFISFINYFYYSLCCKYINY